MRVNVYAEEMTDRVEIISKQIEGQTFTGLRLYLYLPVTVNPEACARSPGVTPDNRQGPFIHHEGDDDSAAITFWGKRDLREVLRVMLNALDKHYDRATPMTDKPAIPEQAEICPTCWSGSRERAGANQCPDPFHLAPMQSGSPTDTASSGTQAQSLKGEIIVHCDAKTLDVGEVYERLGHTQFPATVTLSGAQLHVYFGLPHHHDLYLILSDKPYGDRMVSPVEPVKLQNGMKFYSCPRGHF